MKPLVESILPRPIVDPFVVSLPAPPRASTPPNDCSHPIARGEDAKQRQLESGSVRRAQILRATRTKLDGQDLESRVQRTSTAENGFIYGKNGAFEVRPADLSRWSLRQARHIAPRSRRLLVTFDQRLRASADRYVFDQQRRPLRLMTARSKR